MQRARIIHQARAYSATAFIKPEAAFVKLQAAFESMQRPRETKTRQSAAKSSTLQQNTAKPQGHSSNARVLCKIIRVRARQSETVPGHVRSYAVVRGRARSKCDERGNGFKGWAPFVK
jgi:hypothetical protein